MDQPIFLRILRSILVMTRGYLKCCNVSQLICKRFLILLVREGFINLEYKKNHGVDTST